MPFAVHAAVVVKSIGRTGEVVEAGREGRYRVRVGGLVMSCREDDLREAEQSRRATGKRKGKAANTPETTRAAEHVSVPDTPRRALAEIDLHGRTVQEALEAVEARLDAALRAGLDHFDIVHGRGSGRIKNAVHRYLRDVGAVRRFELLPGNPGVTRVFL